MQGKHCYVTYSATDKFVAQGHNSVDKITSLSV